MKESRYNIWVDHDNSSYVFNGVSGALLRMPGSERNRLRRMLTDPTTDACSPEVLERLAVGRMLLPDDADEVRLLAARYETSRWDRSHFGLTIVTSLGCNFDCPYCFEAKHPSLMAEEVRMAVLALLDEQLPAISSFAVTWFGGAFACEGGAVAPL